jgi:hypothetical protein
MRNPEFVEKVTALMTPVQLAVCAEMAGCPPYDNMIDPSEWLRSIGDDRVDSLRRVWHRQERRARQVKRKGEMLWQIDTVTTPPTVRDRHTTEYREVLDRRGRRSLRIGLTVADMQIDGHAIPAGTRVHWIPMRRTGDPDPYGSPGSLRRWIFRIAGDGDPRLDIFVRHFVAPDPYISPRRDRDRPPSTRGPRPSQPVEGISVDLDPVAVDFAAPEYWEEEDLPNLSLRWMAERAKPDPDEGRI